MSKKETIVLVPAWGMGHIIPMTELAKLFTTTTTTFSIAIVIFDAPYELPSTFNPFISRVASSHPSISFHFLPKPSFPPNYLSNGRIPFGFDLLRFSNPQLTDFLTSISQTATIRALILDMFCSSAMDVARELAIPAYFFFASGLFVLLSFISIPITQRKIGNSLKHLGKSPLPLPGLPPIPTSYLPPQALDGDEITQAMVYHFERYPRADGILVNTFEALEETVVKAVNEGLYDPIPPVYCIGPLIAEQSDNGEKHACLKWLDEQPERSVVFLCFGSMGTFGIEQAKEIAKGLERSGQRFLWVVRSPVTPDAGEKRVGLGKSIVDADLDELLPEGFVERTKERGMVVKNWVPQTAVLGHRAVGGFVSHCGWNSTLEAVSAGVGVIAWPLYAEQKMNMVFLVEEAKVAVEMEGWEEEAVKGEEVERKVKWLMESAEGKELKERARAMRESAGNARMMGGSSEAAWMMFVNGLKERL